MYDKDGGVIFSLSCVLHIKMCILKSINHSLNDPI